MPRALKVTAFTLALTIPVVATAQDTSSWRWSVSGGPAQITNRTFFIAHFIGGSSVSERDTVVNGAQEGRFHGAVALSKRIPGSALTFRTELSYFLATSGPSRFVFDSSFCSLGCRVTPYQVRDALREETTTLAFGAEWLAFPRWRWSPYLLTNIGAYRTRIEWSSDPNATRGNRWDEFFGPATTLGAGLRMHIGRRELFTEFRRQRLWVNQGSDFMSLTLGFRP